MSKDQDVLKDLKENSKAYSLFNANRHINELTKYNFLRLGNPSTGLGIKGLPVAFMTTPLLNLNKTNIEQSDFYTYLNENNPVILKMLNYEGYGGGEYNDGSGTIYKNGTIPNRSNSPFIRLLTNRFVSMDIKDTQMDTKDLGQTFYGYKQKLPTTFINTINGDEFGMTFEETKDIRVLQLFKAWVEYVEAVGRGTMVSSPVARFEKIIDYTASVYYFVLDLDASTILSYHRYTGVVPLNIPYSVMQKTVGESPEPVQIPINFSYSFKEDMNPHILTDFNLTMADSFPSISKNLTTMNAISAGLDQDLSFIPSSDGAKDISEAVTDPIEQLDWSSLDRAQVVLENYADPDSTNKYRFKLKWFNDPKVHATNGITNKSKDKASTFQNPVDAKVAEKGTTAQARVKSKD